MEYCPDRWLVIKITTKETGKVHYRVFATWHGGYLGSDSWKLNSGIVSATLEEDCFIFIGDSASVYACSKYSYGTTGYGSMVLNSLMEGAESVHTEIMDEDTDWCNFKYE